MVLLGLGTFSAKPKTSTRFTHHPIDIGRRQDESSDSES
jgi:hypothetical protein